MRAKEFINEGIWDKVKNAALAMGLGTPSAQANYRIGKMDAATEQLVKKQFLTDLDRRLQTSITSTQAATPAATPATTPAATPATTPAAPTSAATPAAPTPAATPAAPTPATTPAAPTPATTPAAPTSGASTNLPTDTERLRAKYSAMRGARQGGIQPVRVVREDDASSGHAFNVIVQFMKDKIRPYSGAFEQRESDITAMAKVLATEYQNNKNKLNFNSNGAKNFSNLYFDIIKTAPRQSQMSGYGIGNNGQTTYGVNDLPKDPSTNQLVNVALSDVKARSGNKYGFDKNKKQWYERTASGDKYLSNPDDPEQKKKIEDLNRWFYTVKMAQSPGSSGSSGSSGL